MTPGGDQPPTMNSAPSNNEVTVPYRYNGLVDGLTSKEITGLTIHKLKMEVMLEGHLESHGTTGTTNSSLR